MFMVRHGYPGGWRLLDLVRRLGIVKKPICIPVPGGFLDVPLHRECQTDWDESYVLQYEKAFVDALVSAAASLPGSIALVDCGADIGTLSVLLAGRVPRLSRIIAFEPNEEAFPFLESNLRRLSLPAVARAAAVSDFRGRARLDSTDLDRSDSAKFIVADPAGAVTVERVDGLGIGGTSVILKVDVEGAEIDVLRGALETLRAAPAFVVGFEAHREVATRTGIDPIECVRLLESVRPIRVAAAEEPGAHIDSRRPFFEQVGALKVYNLVCSST
jgi:FkbM family methyltransferase